LEFKHLESTRLPELEHGDPTLSLGFDWNFACIYLPTYSMRFGQSINKYWPASFLHISTLPSGAIVFRPQKTVFQYMLIEPRETAADENSTSYFPLLDRIAEGYFQQSTTDEELYQKFLEVLKNDGHMPDPESLSSYQFALSMRSAAPRIEAHYQYYHAAVEPFLEGAKATSCASWVLLSNKQYCSPELDLPTSQLGGKR
jgi:UDP-glucose:glycoprotein glucosyltransferase